MMKSPISFTGQSLGGGLVALMGVFFDKPTVTFDPAPFRRAASLVNMTVLTIGLAFLAISSRAKHGHSFVLRMPAQKSSVVGQD